MKKFLLAAAFGSTLLAAPAFAQDAPRGGGMFERLDANKDGVITRDEFTAEVATRFARLDTNKDGKVSDAEREAGRPAGMGGRAMGRGMSGDMTLADMQAQSAKRFDRIDSNHDGKIDQAERAAIMARMGNRQAPPTGGSDN